MGVLELVGLDVLPEGLDDDRTGLGVYPQQPGQPRVQLKLGGLHRRGGGSPHYILLRNGPDSGGNLNNAI